MSLFELFLIACGLSMDAFAVSVCKGLSVKKTTFRQSLTAGLWFGGFQAALPRCVSLLGASLPPLTTSLQHWTACALRAIIGGTMIRESFSPDECCDGSFSPRAMFPLAVATSIDALAVGITFACLKVSIVPAVSFIGVITFLLSAAGLKIGNVFGSRWRSKAEFAGGLVLILLGTKILLEHLGILSF